MAASKFPSACLSPSFCRHAHCSPGADRQLRRPAREPLRVPERVLVGCDNDLALVGCAGSLRALGGKECSVDRQLRQPAREPLRVPERALVGCDDDLATVGCTGSLWALGGKECSVDLVSGTKGVKIGTGQSSRP